MSQKRPKCPRLQRQPIYYLLTISPSFSWKDFFTSQHISISSKLDTKAWFCRQGLAKNNIELKLLHFHLQPNSEYKLWTKFLLHTKVFSYVNSSFALGPKLIILMRVQDFWIIFFFSECIKNIYSSLRLYQKTLYCYS